MMDYECLGDPKIKMMANLGDISALFCFSFIRYIFFLWD